MQEKESTVEHTNLSNRERLAALRISIRYLKRELQVDDPYYWDITDEDDLRSALDLQMTEYVNLGGDIKDIE
jgi:hypothetical protein